MAARKKRRAPKGKAAANPAAKMDAGWRAFIESAIKKQARKTLWPDPVAPAPTARRKAKKKTAKRVRKRAK